MFFPLSSSYWKKNITAGSGRISTYLPRKNLQELVLLPWRGAGVTVKFGCLKRDEFLLLQKPHKFGRLFWEEKDMIQHVQVLWSQRFLSLHLRKSTLCFFRNRHADKGYKMSAAVPFLPMSPALEGIPGNQICWHCWSRAISMTRLHLGKIWQSTFFVSHLATCNDCPKAVCMGIIGNQSSFRGNPVWWIIDIFCGSHIFDTHIDRHTDRQIDRWVDR